MNNFNVFWTETAKNDLKKISNYVSENTLSKLINSSKKLIFPEQFQFDEYRKDCRRIIINNYKILYQFIDNQIFVVRIFNSTHNPTKSN